MGNSPTAGATEATAAHASDKVGPQGIGSSLSTAATATAARALNIGDSRAGSPSTQEATWSSSSTGDE